MSDSSEEFLELCRDYGGNIKKRTTFDKVTVYTCELDDENTAYDIFKSLMLDSRFTPPEDEMYEINGEGIDETTNYALWGYTYEDEGYTKDGYIEKELKIAEFPPFTSMNNIDLREAIDTMNNILKQRGIYNCWITATSNLELVCEEESIENNLDDIEVSNRLIEDLFEKSNMIVDEYKDKLFGAFYPR